MFELAGRMIENRKESWWVAFHAIDALARATPAVIAPHRDRLLEFLDYDCTWLQTSAVCTLAKIATDPAHYKVVLPAIIVKSSSLRVDSATNRTSKAIADAMKAASPEVKDFASPLLKKTYEEFPTVVTEPNTGAVFGGGAKTIRSRIGAILQQLPDGDEYVRMLPRTTLASHISGKDSDMYSYSGKFETNPALIGTWAWAVWPQPNNPSEIDARIAAYLKGQQGKDATQVDKPKDMLVIQDGGKIAKSKFFGGYFWSGDMLIGVNDDQALKMEVRKVGGYDFLIVERGGFNAVPTTEEAATAAVSKDWHCGYHVYIRQK
jgi:hypothetical protein